MNSRDRADERRRWVSALYLELLHGNFNPGRSSDPSVLRDVRGAMRELDLDDLAALLNEGWRERLVAAWLAGLGARRELLPRLSAMLLASETCFAGQGYCAALACMPCEASARALIAYLDVYLARPDLDYDQRWAIAALYIIDCELGTDHLAGYLGEGGRWESFCAQQHRASDWGLPPLGELIAALRGGLAEGPSVANQAPSEPPPPERGPVRPLRGRRTTPGGT